MSRLPRVLLLNYEFPPIGGGAGHASFQLAKTLVAQGGSVDVITSSPTNQTTSDVADGVRIFRVPSRRRGVHECGWLGAWSYVLSARPLFRRLLREQSYDVIHYFFGLPTGVLSLCAAEAGRIPSVVSLRGSDVPGYDAVNAPLQAVHQILRPVTRRIWSRADAVVANSRALSVLAQPILAGRPIQVVTNAIEADAFSPAASNGRKASAELRLLTVARLTQRKGLQDLFRAMTELRQEPLRLTVQGTGSHQEALKELARTLGISDQVQFAGFCVREQLPSVYRQADVFVMPSLSESCSMAVLEAMACGLPIIACWVGGMAEYVEDGVNGLLVPPGDSQALAQAIRSLLHNASLRAEMGRQSAAKARKDYSWERVTGEYLAIYRRIMDRRNGHGASHAAG